MQLKGSGHLSKVPKQCMMPDAPNFLEESLHLLSAVFELVTQIQPAPVWGMQVFAGTELNCW